MPLALLALTISAFASEVERLVHTHPLWPILTSMPVSRDYYARKVQQGKRHNQALIALARRRCDVLFAMLRDGTFYHPKSATNA